MKKLRHFLFFLLLAVGAVQPAARAQSGLRVDSLINFPMLPGDTAIAGLVYDSIRVVVHNYSNVVFTGDISIYLSADSLLHVDTLLNDIDTSSFVTLAPGADTILNADTNYVFDAVNYAAGDNIVVVWPSLRIIFPIDSVYVNVHFSITGLEELQAGDLKLWPVPARQVLRFEYRHKEMIEQVRIFDMSGRLVLNTNVPPETLDVTSWSDGLYFVLITGRNGTRVAKKILKQ